MNGDREKKVRVVFEFEPFQILRHRPIISGERIAMISVHLKFSKQSHATTRTLESTQGNPLSDFRRKGTSRGLKKLRFVSRPKNSARFSDCSACAPLRSSVSNAHQDDQHERKASARRAPGRCEQRAAPPTNSPRPARVAGGAAQDAGNTLLGARLYGRCQACAARARSTATAQGDAHSRRRPLAVKLADMSHLGRRCAGRSRPERRVCLPRP